MRILIVGAGVMGCATALELSARGVREIIVLERAVPGAEASSAAAGMLAAQIESKDADELRAFVKARQAYGPWATQLKELTGIDIGHRQSGALHLASTPVERDAMHATVKQHLALGLRAEALEVLDARRVEACVGGAHHGGAFFPDEAQVDPPQLLRALMVATARAKVTIRSGATVASLLVEGGKCVGVRLDGGDEVRTDGTVLAAGSWSSLVGGVPADLPRVRPVRGQLVMLEERPPRLSTIVFGHGSYVVPRGDGRVVCGSTMEDVGHKREVTAGGVHGILGAAIAIAPALRDAELVRSWSNFRPHSAAGEPLVGRSPLPGLFLATGHHRNGILLAKVTADAVADAIHAGS